MVNSFKRILVKKVALAATLKLKGRIAKRKFFNSNNLSINLCKDSISSLYLAWMVIIMVVILEIIVLEIDYYTERSIASDGI